MACLLSNRGAAEHARRTLASELNAASAPHPELENRFSSRDYGAKVQSLSVCRTVRAALPFTLNFVIIPIRCGEDEGERLSLAMDVVT